MAKVPGLRCLVSLYNNTLGLWRYAAYYRDEVDRLRAQQQRDLLKIRDLDRENRSLKAGWRRVRR